MIKAKVYIKEYDWTIYAHFAVDKTNTDEIFNKLIQFGSSYYQAIDACAILEDNKPNCGITYSNHILKTTILVITKTTSTKEFVNTFVHEVSHIQNHIIKTYHLDNNSEQVCYMIGTIAEQLYTNCFVIMTTSSNISSHYCIIIIDNHLRYNNFIYFYCL